MSLYHTIMGMKQGAAAPGAGSVLDTVDTPYREPDPLPELTPDLFSSVFPEGLSHVSVTSTTQRLGQGPLANKQLPIDEGRGSQVVAAAKSFLGVPYVWGGASAKGVDCSGLVQLAFRSVGLNLPRVSYQQANSGQRVSLRNLAPGDLVAWDNSSRNDGADHIAIFAGNGMIIEAPRPGEAVRIRRLGSNEGAFGVRILGGNRG